MTVQYEKTACLEGFPGESVASEKNHKSAVTMRDETIMHNTTSGQNQSQHFSTKPHTSCRALW